MINPCCCCSAEAGVYVLLFFNLLYFAGCVIFGVIFSSWTITLALEESYPLGYKTVSLVIWIAYVLYFVFETFLGSRLLQSVNRSDSATEFHNWVFLRGILLVFISPAVFLHVYIHFCLIEVTILLLIAVYQIYYLWVVKYYAYELDIELETESVNNVSKV